MDSGGITCAFLGCDILVGPESPRCELCPDTPDCSAVGFRSSFHYCSHHHLALDKNTHEKICTERQSYRAFDRIGDICNVGFLCKREALFPCCNRITSYSEDSDRYYATFEPANTCISEGRQWYPSDMPEEVLRAAISYEHCIASIVLLTLFVSWCLEGFPNSDTQEWLLEPIKKKPIQITLAGQRTLVAADLHAVFVISQSPPSNRTASTLVVDASSHQYGHKINNHEAEPYKRDRMVRDPEVLPGGHFYEIHARRIKEHSEDDNTMICEYMVGIVIRIMNKTLHRAINEQLGGRKHLLEEMGHDEFLTALDSIRVALREAFELVQPQVQDALQHSFKGNWCPFQHLLRECYDEGDAEMWMAYERRKRQDRN